MMDLVVGGCVEDEAQGSQISQQLSVDPELVQEVELTVDQKLGGGNQKTDWLVEPVSHVEQALKHWLSKQIDLKSRVL